MSERPNPAVNYRSAQRASVFTPRRVIMGVSAGTLAVLTAITSACGGGSEGSTVSPVDTGVDNTPVPTASKRPDTASSTPQITAAPTEAETDTPTPKPTTSYETVYAAVSSVTSDQYVLDKLKHCNGEDLPKGSDWGTPFNDCTEVDSRLKLIGATDARNTLKLFTYDRLQTLEDNHELTHQQAEDIRALLEVSGAFQ